MLRMLTIMQVPPKTNACDDKYRNPHNGNRPQDDGANKYDNGKAKGTTKSAHKQL